jgi:hypothetical protein
MKTPNFVLFVSSFENSCAKVRTRSRRPGSVIPAKAGIQAGMGIDSGLRRNDEP